MQTEQTSVEQKPTPALTLLVRGVRSAIFYILKLSRVIDCSTPRPRAMPPKKKQAGGPVEVAASTSKPTAQKTVSILLCKNEFN
jgi:hypothetical protein